MSNYWFNRKEISQKAKERYSKEKAGEYYLQNKEAIKEKSKNRYKNLSKEKKDKIKEYQGKRYQCLTNLIIAMVVLNILLVITKAKLLNHYVLSYLK